MSRVYLWKLRVRDRTLLFERLSAEGLRCLNRDDTRSAPQNLELDISMTRTLEELRDSLYHQQLGRKMCAAYVAQQQGITLTSAFKKVPDPVGDLWLMVAEFARQANAEEADLICRNGRLRRSTGLIM